MYDGDACKPSGEKPRMELEEQRNLNGADNTDIERKLVMLEEEEQKMHRKM